AFLRSQPRVRGAGRRSRRFAPPGFARRTPFLGLGFGLDRAGVVCTPTVRHASRTTFAPSLPNSRPAMAVVAAAASRKSERSFSASVSATYQTRPALSHARPPNASAARQNARLGMLE